MMRRPDVFTLDYSHPLAQQLVYFPDLPAGPAGGGIRISDVSIAARSTTIVQSGSGTVRFLCVPELQRRAVSLISANSQAVELPSSLAFPLGGFSWGHWIFVGSTINAFSLASRLSAASDGFDFVVGAGGIAGVCRFRAHRGTGADGVDIVLPTTAWSHVWCNIVLVGGIRFLDTYLNGAYAGRSAQGLAAGTMSNSQPPTVGKRGSTFFSGSVADPIFYNRALSPSEIAILADRTDPMLGGLIREERPVLYFDMGGASTGETHDSGPVLINSNSDISSYAIATRVAAASFVCSCNLDCTSEVLTLEQPRSAGAVNMGTLNGFAINAESSNRVQAAFCDISAASNVTINPLVTRFVTSSIIGVNLLTASATQRWASTATIDVSANLLATNPKMKYASSAIVISMSDTGVYGLVTRFGIGHISARSELFVDTVANQMATSAIQSVAGLNCNPVITRFCNASANGASAIESNGTRRAMVSSSVSAGVSIIADGGYSIAANVSLGGSANCTSIAGYGIPSLSIFGSKAEVFAYGRQQMLAGTSLACSCNASAVAIAGFGGVANISGQCSISATAVAVQGQCDDLSGKATVSAIADYRHMAQSKPESRAVISNMNAHMKHSSSCSINGSATSRVETKVNNELEGFAVPGAASTLGINVNGVAVAMTIGHVEGYANISASADYWHMSKSTASSSAELNVVGVRGTGASAAIVVGADSEAIAHRIHEMIDSNSIVGASSCKVNGSIFYLIDKDRVSSIVSECSIVANSSYIFMPKSDILPASEVFVSEDGCILTLFSNAAISGVAHLTAQSLGNLDALDPLERTMFRPKVDREMVRPFSDRDMKTTRT